MCFSFKKIIIFLFSLLFILQNSYAIYDFRFVKNTKIIEQIKNGILKSGIEKEICNDFKYKKLSLDYSKIVFGNVRVVDEKTFNNIAFFIPVLGDKNNLISEILVEASMNKPFLNQDYLITFFNSNPKLDNLKIKINKIIKSLSNVKTIKYENINIIEDKLLKPRDLLSEYELYELAPDYKPVSYVDSFESNDKIYYSFLASEGCDECRLYSCAVILKNKKFCLLLESPAQYL